MRRHRSIVRLAALAAICALAFGRPAVQAAPAQQAAALSCRWQNAGSSTLDQFDTGSVYDPNANSMWVYSGLDSQLKLSNRIEMISMTGTAASPKVSHKAVNAPAATIFAPTCAFRNKGAESDDTAVYCFGGSKNPTVAGGGSGEPLVQRFLVKKGAWESSVSVSGSFTPRWGAAAGWDPVHDVIWVVGGVQQCSLQDLIDGKTCQARPISTSYLSFEGGLKWNAGPGNETVFGHAVAYDSAAQRLLFVGGTTNGRDGIGYLKQMDLKDPDVTKVKLASLGAGGTAPAAFLVGAAYDASVNALVTYGGVSRGHLSSKETAETRTLVLDLAATPPQWVNISGQSIGERIGGTMQFDSKQNASIFTLGRKSGTSSISTVRTTNALSCSRNSVPPTPTGSGPAPTNTPGTGPRPTDEVRPTPTLVTDPVICEAIKSRVPAAAVNDAVAAPDKVAGYKQACNPNLPAGPSNPLRRYLGLRNPGQVYHPIFNSLMWKCGCP